MPNTPEPIEAPDPEALEREAMDRVWARVERTLRETPPPGPEPTGTPDGEVLEQVAMDRVWPRVEQTLRESPPSDRRPLTEATA